MKYQIESVLEQSFSFQTLFSLCRWNKQHLHPTTPSVKFSSWGKWTQICILIQSNTQQIPPTHPHLSMWTECTLRPSLPTRSLLSHICWWLHMSLHLIRSTMHSPYHWIVYGRCRLWREIKTNLWIISELLGYF